MVKQASELTHAARRKIDDDIDILERRLQSLKTRRNELSPISVLPPEILSTIFILSRDWSTHVQFYNHQAPWIIVGHICRHWRQIALGCPSLWSVPVLTKPDLAEEMIRRSKTSTLTIRSIVLGWTLRMFESLEVAMAQIHRIQSVDLSLGSHPEKIESIFSLLLQPAPLLEHISLRNNNQLSFPADALSDAPCLRSIDFHGLNLSWGSTVFRRGNLTDLRLADNHVAASGSSTFSQMIDALRHLPYLRILHLMDSIPSHITTSGNEKTLEFKFLEHLELRAEAVDCVFFLMHIRYPPQAKVRLYSSSTTVEVGLTIFSLIGQNLRRTQTAEAGIPRSPFIIRSAQLRSDTDLNAPEINFLDLNQGDSMRNLWSPSRTLGQTITIRLNSTRTLSHAYGRLLTSLYNFFDLSSLQCLIIDWRFTYNEIHMIRDSLGKLPKLEIIKLRYGFLPEFCFAIAGSLEDPPTESSEKAQTCYPLKSQHSLPPVTVFPALRTLVINHVDFQEYYHPEDMEPLVDVLMKRSDMNAPIERLCLEYCRGVQAWQIRLLGELVVDLEVEGRVIDMKVFDYDDGDY